MSDKKDDIGIIEVFKFIITGFIESSFEGKVFALLSILIIILIVKFLIDNFDMQGTPGNMPFQP